MKKSNARKTKENASHAAADSASSRQGISEPAFQLVDNRQEAIQLMALHETIQNSAQVSQLKMPAEYADQHMKATAEGGMLQRKIKVKTGETYADSSKLPKELSGDKGMKDKADESGTYLALSGADLIKRTKGQKAEILSPHRHLIGEVHTDSHFEEAVANWGWGADKMEEGLNTSTDVVDAKSQEWMTTEPGFLQPNPHYQSKALENLHAKILASMSIMRSHFMGMADMCNIAASNSVAIEKKDQVEENQKNFNDAFNLIKILRSNIQKEWDEATKPNWDDYANACNARLKKSRGTGNTSDHLLYDMAKDMQKRWQSMPLTLSALIGSIYNLWDSWIETGKKAKLREKEINEFIKDDLDLFSAHLMAMTKAEAGVITGDNSNDKLIDDAWKKAASHEGKPVNDISPIREIFMQHNIEANLKKPGIVLIGNSHVKNLNGKIADAKYHMSYDKFVEDTEKA